MAKMATDDMFLMKCEKIVNETWSKAALHYDNIKRIIESGSIDDEKDEIVLMIAANAALQKMTLDKAQDSQYFEIDDKAPCGITLKTQCPCNRDVCLLKK